MACDGRASQTVSDTVSESPACGTYPAEQTARLISEAPMRTTPHLTSGARPGDALSAPPSAERWRAGGWCGKAGHRRAA